MRIQSNRRQNENWLHSNLQPEFHAPAGCIQLMICTVTSPSLRQALDAPSLRSAAHRAGDTGPPRPLET